MTINSYFYDSVDGDRAYGAADFAAAFNIITKTGIFPKDTAYGLGFDIGGTNYTTLYAGKAMVNGRFVELTGTETLTVPAGTYSGQIVLRVDYLSTRIATVVAKQNRTPQQDSTAYEMPLYNTTVTNGVITSVADQRPRGGFYEPYHGYRTLTMAGTWTTNAGNPLRYTMINKNTLHVVGWISYPNYTTVTDLVTTFPTSAGVTDFKTSMVATVNGQSATTPCSFYATKNSAGTAIELHAEDAWATSAIDAGKGHITINFCIPLA